MFVFCIFDNLSLHFTLQFSIGICIEIVVYCYTRISEIHGWNEGFVRSIDSLEYVLNILILILCSWCDGISHVFEWIVWL